MSYKDQSLQVVHEGLTGSSEFVYETSDAALEVSAPDYFLAARHRLRRNDILRVIAEADSAGPAFTVFVVSAIGDERIGLVSVPDLVEDRCGGHAWARVPVQAKPRRGARSQGTPASAEKEG